MPADLPIWIFHVKPQLYEETEQELAQIDPARIHILEQGKTYTVWPLLGPLGPASRGVDRGGSRTPERERC